MDRELRDAVKGLLSNALNLCDRLDETRFGLKTITEGKTTSREQLKTDILRYAMYLSASDGTVSWEEAALLSDIWEDTLTSDTIVRVIKETNTYSTQFESTPPISLELFVAYDKLGVNFDGAHAYEMMIGLFESVGKALVACDGDVDSQEREDLNIYLNMMRDYAVCELANNERVEKNTGTTFVGGKR